VKWVKLLFSGMRSCVAAAATLAALCICRSQRRACEHWPSRTLHLLISMLQRRKVLSIRTRSGPKEEAWVQPLVATGRRCSERQEPQTVSVESENVEWEMGGEIVHARVFAICDRAATVKRIKTINTEAAVASLATRRPLPQR